MTSATLGHQVYLSPGTNTAITVTVMAENGSTNTYTVMVYQERITNGVRQRCYSFGADVLTE